MAGKHTGKQLLAAAPIVLPPHVCHLLGDEADALLNALQEPAPVSIRLNPAKPAGMNGQRVPWCADGRYLPERPVFTLDPQWHAGGYYVQEAASMLLEQAFKACTRLPEAALVLDLCAAPGGKSTHLAALLPPQALLVSNEPVGSRLPALLENLWKWGRPDTVVTSAQPEEFLPMGTFCDLILVDAPCSGEGMFRKDPQARAQWGENLVRTCAARQHSIVDAAWALLKPGGYLIYSTCTWETSENEDQVARLLARGAELVPVPMEEPWGVVRTDGGLRCYPHQVRGEGFFIGLLRKPAPAGMPVFHADDGDAAPVLPLEAVRWLRAAESLCGVESNGTWHALRKPWHRMAALLMHTVHTAAPGVPVARKKGNAWTPHPALALNGLLQHEAFPALNLGREQALSFLRGEALPASGAAGAAWVQYNGFGLGWVHGVGNRWNNQWPAAWRIRMR